MISGVIIYNDYTAAAAAGLHAQATRILQKYSFWPLVLPTKTTTTKNDWFCTDFPLQNFVVP